MVKTKILYQPSVTTVHLPTVFTFDLCDTNFSLCYCFFGGGGGNDARVTNFAICIVNLLFTVHIDVFVHSKFVVYSEFFVQSRFTVNSKCFFHIEFTVHSELLFIVSLLFSGCFVYSAFTVIVYIVFIVYFEVTTPSAYLTQSVSVCILS